MLGILRENLANFGIIRFGDGIKNKVRLLKIAFLQSVPERLMCLLSSKGKVEEAVENLWRGTVVKINGFKYSLIDRESFDIVNESESFISPWLKPKNGEVFLDIGAHIGKYTFKVAREVGKTGLVFAVEPNPNNYQMLQKGIMLNKIHNVIALNIAAWNIESTLKLFIGHLAGHHSAKIDWKLGYYRVKARPMDNVVEEFGISKVDWIKIDVEGAEWEVLLGLKKIISQHKAKLIVELSGENIGRVKKFIQENQYDIVKISPTFEGIIYGIPRKYAYFLFLPLQTN